MRLQCLAECSSKASGASSGGETKSIEQLILQVCRIITSPQACSTVVKADSDAPNATSATNNMTTSASRSVTALPTTSQKRPEVTDPRTCPNLRREWG